VEMDELFYIIDMVSRTNNQSKSTFKSVPRIDDNGDIIFVDGIQRKSKEELIPVINQIYENIKLLDKIINNNDFYEAEAVASEIKRLSNEIDAEELKNYAFKIQLATRRGNLGKVIKYAIEIHHEFNTYKKSVL